MSNDAFALMTWPVSAFQYGGDLIDMTIRSQRVIAARLPTIADAMRNPLTADHGELARMVTEKVAAFQDSGKTVSAASEKARQAANANARAFSRMAGGAPLWPHEWMALASENMAAAAAWAALPAGALAPLSRRVTANDKRLRG